MHFHFGIKAFSSFQPTTPGMQKRDLMNRCAETSSRQLLLQPFAREVCVS